MIFDRYQSSLAHITRTKLNVPLTGSPTQMELSEGSNWADNSLRTESSRKDDLENYREGLPAKECHSVICEPISDYFASEPLTRISCPILHVNLGIVNCCLNELISVSKGDSGGDDVEDQEVKDYLNEFQRLTNVVKTNYWNGFVNGNGCVLIQKHAQFLVDFKGSDLRVGQIGEVLLITDKIRSKLYRVGYMNDEQLSEIEILFSQLEAKWKECEVLEKHSLLKLHYLIKHSLDFISHNSGNYGKYALGLFSEHEFESCHRRFRLTLGHFPPQNTDRLEKAVSRFNAVRFSTF